MSNFDWSNPEASLAAGAKEEEERREKIRKGNEIPDGEKIESKVIEVSRGTAQSGSPKWMLEVSLRAPGKPWHKFKRTLHFPDNNAWCVGRFWDILKAWGIHPSVCVGAKDPIARLMDVIEEAIDNGAQLPLECTHGQDRNDPKKVRINFMERTEDIEQVFADDAEAPAEQEEVAEEEEPVVEEVEDEKPAPRKPRRPYSAV
jgi:hypothetical protein